MYQTISKSEFKPKALAYLRQVEQTGKPIIITHNNKPTAKITPIKKKTTEEVLASLRGSVTKYIDPLEPVGLEDWEALK